MGQPVHVKPGLIYSLLGVSLDTTQNTKPRPFYALFCKFSKVDGYENHALSIIHHQKLTEHTKRKRGEAWSFGWCPVRNLTDCIPVTVVTKGFL